jgi:protein-L-isoaspartate(D-aspartate) O-methyltransferase
MVDFVTARRMMVDGQIRTQDVTDLRILTAFGEVPRERFVPAESVDLSYLDRDLPLDAGKPDQPARHLLNPRLLAKMIQALELGPDDRVLDVGCTTGYATAVLARLAGEVIGLEEDEALAATAREVLRDLGCANAKVQTGPLTHGAAAAAAPFAAILIEGAAETVPESLSRQLKDGGRLVCILRRGPVGKAMLYRSVGGDISGRALFDAAAPPLRGFAQPAAFVF